MAKQNKIKLHPAEQRVYDLVVRGLSNKQVGEKLFITEKSVKFHLTSIYKFHGVKQRAELLVKHYDEKKSPICWKCKKKLSR